MIGAMPKWRINHKKGRWRFYFFLNYVILNNEYNYVQCLGVCFYFHINDVIKTQISNSGITACFCNNL